MLANWQMPVTNIAMKNGRGRAVKIVLAYMKGRLNAALRVKMSQDECRRFVHSLTSVVLLGMAVDAAHASFSDPAGSGPILGAVQWLQGTLLGTVATVVAVIAVASVGFLMLTGRMNWRYGVTVIIGCFILFGATSIVAGIQSSTAVGG